MAESFCSAYGDVESVKENEGKRRKRDEKETKTMAGSRNRPGGGCPCTGDLGSEKQEGQQFTEYRGANWHGEYACRRRAMPRSEPKELNKELYMDAGKDVEERVAELLSQMTLDEKIAQMIQPEQSAISYQEITEYGSVPC